MLSGFLVFVVDAGLRWHGSCNV